jgi:hypothetical protein
MVADTLSPLSSEGKTKALPEPRARAAIAWDLAAAG